VVWFNFICSHLLGAEKVDRFDLGAEDDPWLESANGRAPGAPLAGPIGIATTFGSEEDEFPPSAAIAKEFRPRAEVNRPHSPACPTCPEDGGGGSSSGAAEGCCDLQSGQQEAFEAQARSRIRAKDHVRHEDRNDKE
jgi:hypothetical protein